MARHLAAMKVISVEVVENGFSGVMTFALP